MSKSAVAQSPEALVVGLAKTGDAKAFAELVRRRQSWIRNLMTRYCGDPSLADDLAQQSFLQAWKDIGKLRDPHKFAGWLRQIAVNVWYQHARKNDALKNAQELDPANDENAVATKPSTNVAMDLDHALGQLTPDVRQCIVLSYHEGMSHREIAELTGMPIGTIKSHISRGSARLKVLLSAYTNAESEVST